jgi:hypothetical protein
MPISNTWKPRQLQPATESSEVPDQGEGNLPPGRPLAGKCQEAQTFLEIFSLFAFLTFAECVIPD